MDLITSETEELQYKKLNDSWI